MFNYQRVPRGMENIHFPLENHQQMAFFAIAAIAKKGMVTFFFSTFWVPAIWQAQKQKNTGVIVLLPLKPIHLSCPLSNEGAVTEGQSHIIVTFPLPLVIIHGKCN